MGTVKRIGGIALVTLVALLGLAGCENEKDRLLEAVDGMVYLYITAKVEGNDDVLNDVLVEDAKGILKPGRHAYPGDAEKMGERYYIKRFDHLLEEGEILYYVKFYRPSTGKLDYYNVKAVHTDEGWRISRNRSVDAAVMKEAIGENEGTIVHEYVRE